MLVAGATVRGRRRGRRPANPTAVPAFDVTARPAAADACLAPGSR